MRRAGLPAFVPSRLWLRLGDLSRRDGNTDGRARRRAGAGLDQGWQSYRTERRYHAGVVTGPNGVLCGIEADAPKLEAIVAIDPTKTEMQKAPQPSVDRVEELASRILSGDIILPKFQREFVWSKKQSYRSFGICIASNYPIGSVLLWRSRETLNAERSIADLTIGKQAYD